MMNSEIKKFVEDVYKDIHGNWDFDDSMAVNRAKELSYGRLIFALHNFDPKVLEWLSFFTARRALSCWELSCEDERPRKIINEIRDYLVYKKEIDLVEASKPTTSPYNDCRYSDTQTASDSIAECAQYINTHTPLYCIFCISSADIAYDHVLTDHKFRNWFLEYALPIACEKREMNEQEQDALRPS